MCLRTDNQNGGISYLYLNSDILNGNLKIITPDDKNVDLVVFRVARARDFFQSANNTVGQPSPKIKLGWFDASLVLNQKELNKFDITEGAEMFFVGLFTPFYGANRNIPICRFGHLSMLPDEPIVFGNGKAQNLYLMETEAYGGNSGSPAFFSFDQGYFARRLSNLRSGAALFNSADNKRILFAGVVNAYFPDYEQIKLQNTTVIPLSQGNTGIASIVPAPYLYDILFSKSEQDFRNEVWSLVPHTGYK